ncbi:hypothetical protein PbJCM13498_30530 [Prolixibacter bellariivorans]|uniref:Uncharacterized protein n=1 Tax=Prolixibacter bellariivorans TaxID=314319 RepID=A0A5M4B1Z7_9BACT|nr:hypothetical protein [Prolixibacter bellariivorans]GET34190.1 hypothetical protein PbJCM13498_30530 [Prolixibacter bellariivorans]
MSFALRQMINLPAQMKLKKLHITNPVEFLSKIQEIADFSINPDDYRFNKTFTDSDYIGEIESGNFVIYDAGKSFLGKRIILKFVGQVDKNNDLNLQFYISNLWVKVFNATILLVLGILMLVYAYYLGGLFIIFALIQATVEYNQIMKHRSIFLKKIQSII